MLYTSKNHGIITTLEERDHADPTVATVALGRDAKSKQEPGERLQEFAPETAVMSAIRAKIDGFPREVRRAAGISSYDPELEE